MSSASSRACRTSARSPTSVSSSASSTPDGLAPRRRPPADLYFFAALIGGITSNVLFGAVAIAGYLVTGLGDAIGEPVGTMFGAHKYQVRSLSSVPATRSLERSSAVFVMSAVALLLAAAVSPHITLGPFGSVKVALIAAVSVLVEAVSPRGWDNLTMQAVPSALVWYWLA